MIESDISFVRDEFFWKACDKDTITRSRAYQLMFFVFDFI
jgi:hypothetical protein